MNSFDMAWSGDVQFFGLANVSIPVSHIAYALHAAEGKVQTRETTRNYILAAHGHGSKQGGSGLGFSTDRTADEHSQRGFASRSRLDGVEQTCATREGDRLLHKRNSQGGCVGKTEVEVFQKKVKVGGLEGKSGTIMNPRLIHPRRC